MLSPATEIKTGSDKINNLLICVVGACLPDRFFLTQLSFATLNDVCVAFSQDQREQKGLEDKFPLVYSIKAIKDE